jgi:hypothetical protein
MGELIDLFTKQVIPGGEAVRKAKEVESADSEEDFIYKFVNEYLMDVIDAVEELDRSSTVEELEENIRRVQQLVAKWPKSQR